MRLLLAPLVLVLVLLPSTAVLAGGGGHSICDGFGEGDGVVLLDSCMQPVGLLHASGADVQVRNDGDVPHTYTAVDGSFDSGVLAPGASTEIAVDPGVHRVYCTLHATRAGTGMSGLLLVGAEAAGAREAAVVGPDASSADDGAVDAAAAAGVAAPPSRTDGSGAALALSLIALGLSVVALRTSRRRRAAPAAG